MRPLLYVLSAMVVIGLAFWAYRQNYATQQAIKQVARLQNEIGTLRDDLAMQQAEWAYENRPSRLRELVMLNFDRLPLMPMTPEQFGAIGQVAMPSAAPADGPGADTPTAMRPLKPSVAPPAAPKSGAIAGSATASLSGPGKITHPVDTSASTKRQTP